MREAMVRPTPAGRLETVIGADRFARFAGLADAARDRFLGRTLWHINATETGGVAEMLRAQVATAIGLGVDTRWLVIDGDTDFVAITKRIHNGIHGSPGDGGPLGAAEHRHYQSVVAANRNRLREVVRAGDIVVLHDPQTAGMVDMAKDTGARVIWRSHIGRDIPTESSEAAWGFVAPYVGHADRLVFSRSQYVPAALAGIPVAVIAPAIDAFAVKNIPLEHASVVAILGATGLLQQPAGIDVPAAFPRNAHQDGLVTRRAQIIREGGPLDPATPLVVQVSRWDALKDMRGVLTAFAAGVATDPTTGEAHLALVGPDVAGVSADPESVAVRQDCVAAWHRLDAAQRQRISLVSVPMDDVEENAAIVNAVQRHASIVTQKSLVEGFGLTVAEAMWKSRPVVASAMGGILDQITEGENGLLVEPTDHEGFAGALRRLLADPAEGRRLGQAARERVWTHYLPDRQLTQWWQTFQAVAD